MKYFTSDTHYGHHNVIKYSDRPFEDVATMNETLIKNWNAKIKPEDEVFHLGDVSFMGVEDTLSILKRLNGKKHLIYGNHDKVIKQNKELQNEFEEVMDYHELYLTDNTCRGGNRMVVLCHYAMLVWNKSHYGSFMLHGHSHGTLKYPIVGRIMDVGVDCQNLYPVSETEILKTLSAITPKVIDHHN